MRKLLSSILAATVLLAAANPCLAQTKAKGKQKPAPTATASVKQKPLVVVSFAGYDRLVGDIAMIGKLGGNPNMGKQLEMMALMLPQGEGAKGPLALDTKQPWGAVLLTDAETPSSYAFLPATDIKPLIELAKTQSGADIKAEKGVYEIPTETMTLYAMQKGNWAYVADSKGRLKKVAADPAALLGDLPKRYGLAIRASIKNLPAEYREQLLAQLRAGAEAGMQQMPSESQDDHALRLGVAKQAVEQLTTLVNDMDELLLGWNVDAETKSTYLDLEMTAQAGTKLAEQFAEIKTGKTKFGGLMLPGAAVTASSVGTISDADVAQAKSALDSLRKTVAKELEGQGLTDDEVKLVSRLFDEAIGVIQKTVEAKKTDVGLAVMLDPKALTVLAGVAIADGAKLDKALQEMVDEVQKSGRASLVNISAETYEGVQLHMVSMPTPEPEMAPLVGDTLEVVLGIADDRLLMAVGRDAAKTLKKAIDQSKSAADKEVQPLEIALAVTPIARFLAEVGEDEQVKATAGMLAGLFERAGDKDRVTVTAKPIAHGIRVRLEVEEGLLKSLGSMSQMLSPPGAAPPGGEF